MHRSSPSPHGRGNHARGSGGATPGQRRPFLFVLSSLPIKNVRVLESRRILYRGACCPLRLRLEQGWTRHAGTPIHQFSSPDAPPGPSPHVRGNRTRGSGGATPGQRRTSLFVLSSLRIENVRVLDNRAALAGGPAAPRPPRRLRLGQGRKTTPARPFTIFHRQMRRPPPRPRMSGAIMRAGSGGRTPGVKMEEDECLTLASGKVMISTKPDNQGFSSPRIILPDVQCGSRSR